jgi:hypothetical protein
VCVPDIESAGKWLWVIMSMVLRGSPVGETECFEVGEFAAAMNGDDGAGDCARGDVAVERIGQALQASGEEFAVMRG